MAALTAVMIGAGQRGFHAYGRWAKDHGAVLRFVAVVEPDEHRRARFAAEHGIREEMTAASFAELPEGIADTAFIAAPDHAHHGLAAATLAAGYHVYLEKPMAASPEDCADLAARARDGDHITAVGHVLRTTPFFRAVRHAIESGRLGDIVTVEHRENVATWHMAHSFVRGNWATAADSTPMIVAKCCHDFDILDWVLGGEVTRLSSFGSLVHFRPEHAPEDAAARCIDCPLEDCPFDARPVYLNMANTGWPVHVVTDDLSRSGRLAALRDGPYGRCVYTAGSDVVDHQVVAMERSSGTSVTLAMHGHSAVEERTMRYDGTKATLRGRFGPTQVIQLTDHATGEVEDVPIPHAAGGHRGGDDGAIRRFVAAVRGEEEPGSTIADALDAHLAAFAAEESRRSGETVEMAGYRNRYSD